MEIPPDRRHCGARLPERPVHVENRPPPHHPSPTLRQAQGAAQGAGANVLHLRPAPVPDTQVSSDAAVDASSACGLPQHDSVGESVTDAIRICSGGVNLRSVADPTEGPTRRADRNVCPTFILTSAECGRTCDGPACSAVRRAGRRISRMDLRRQRSDGGFCVRRSSRKGC